MCGQLLSSLPPLREPLNKESSQHPTPPPPGSPLAQWRLVAPHCALCGAHAAAGEGPSIKVPPGLGWGGRCAPGTRAASAGASAPPACLQGLGHGDFPKGSLPSISLPWIEAPSIPGYQLSEVRGQPSSARANPTTPNRTRAAMTQEARAERTLRRSPGFMFH